MKMTNSSSIHIFKILYGWCVSIPVFYYENEDDIAEKIRDFQSKINEGSSDDPILDKLLSKTKVKRTKQKGEYRVAPIKDHSLLYFSTKHQALFFINLLMKEDGDQSDKLDIEGAYKLSLKQITE